MAISIGELTAIISANTKQFDRAMKGVEKEIGVVNKRSAKLAAGMKTMGRSFTVAATAIGVGTIALGKFAQAGTRVNTVQTAFLRRVDGSSDAIRGLTRVTRGLITQQDLMLSFNQAVTLGAAKTTEEFGKMAEAALVLGRTLGLDARFALESMTLGIGRQSRMILDNLGLIVRIEEANKRYAETLNTVTSALDDDQKREAFRIETLRQIDKAVGDLGGLILDAGDAWKQLTVEVTNAVDQMKLATAQSGRLKTAFEGLRDIIRQIGGGPSGVAQAIVDSIGNVTQIKVLQDRYQDFFDLIPSVQAAAGRSIDEINESFKDLGITGTDLDFILRSIEDQLAKVAKAAKTVAEEVKGIPTAPFRIATGQNIFFGTGAGAGVDRSQAAQDRIAAQQALPIRRLTKPLKEVGDRFEEIGLLASRAAREFGTFGNILSSIIAGIAQGGLLGIGQAAITGVAAIIGGLFGGGNETQEALKANTEALRNNTRSIEGVVARAPGRIIGALTGALEEVLGIGRGRTTFNPLESGEILARALERAGVSMDELAKFAAELGLTFSATLEGLQQLLQALMTQTLPGVLSEAQRRIELLDIGKEGGAEGAIARFNAFRDAIAEFLGGGISGLGAAFARLDVSSIQAFVDGIMQQIADNTFDFGRLPKDISKEEFLAALGTLESLGDAAEDAANELNGLTGALRNAPAGFKVALSRFNATTPFGGGGLPNTIPSPTRPGDINITTLNVSANDPAEMVASIRREARRGGVTGLDLAVTPTAPAAGL